MTLRDLSIALAIVVLVAAPGAAQEMSCADCHDEVAAGMVDDIHMHVRAFEVQGHAVGCEGCHGDGTAHMESGDPSLIVNFEEPAEWNGVCVDCHGPSGLMEWQASVHASEGVACLDCHGVHDVNAPLDACTECHATTVAKFQLPSHHPVREGYMTCASCHDSHSASEFHLKTAQRTNDLCFTCHQAMEGPFVFEHDPVNEDCAICHDPHGTVADNLQTVNQPTLCLQCHDMHFHAGYEAVDEHDVGGFHRTSGFGEQSFTIAFTTQCTQCHSQIHGSDLPSQAVPGLGQGLTR